MERNHPKDIFMPGYGKIDYEENMKEANELYRNMQKYTHTSKKAKEAAEHVFCGDNEIFVRPHVDSKGTKYRGYCRRVKVEGR